MSFCQRRGVVVEMRLSPPRFVLAVGFSFEVVEIIAAFLA